jgi:beta-phosphoglucomutase-like phosphatase (HAD superfamily)
MLKAILWDNDGVLVDTEGLYFQASRDGFRRSEWPTMVEEGSDQSLS